MRRTAITTTRPGRLLALAGLLTATAAAAAALVLIAGGAPAGAAAGPTTAFTGQITGGNGRYAHVRGAVRLVLHAAMAATSAPAGPSSRPLAFTLTVTSPACSKQHVLAPRRCLSLRGSLAGTALAGRHLPDVGTTFALTGHGRLTPVGAVQVSGTTSGLGFVARGRFPLTLRVQTPTGRLTITAQGPLVNGFHSPF
jgi:hypothetical protein